MHKFLSVLLLLTGLSPARPDPCETYACDSTVVQSILDANGLSQYSPVEVTRRDTLSGRIVLLNLNREEDLAGFRILPDEVGRLTALRKLWLADQNLNSLPEAIGQLELLEDLILHGNALEGLPEATSRLTRLRRLVLSGNPLKAFPSVVTALRELSYLSLGGRGIDSVPDAIWTLTSLTELSLTNTALTTLPGDIARLSNLKSLTLSGNKLIALPKELAELENLMFLMLDHNAIADLPEDITALELHTLSVSNNGMCRLSSGLEEWVDARASEDWRGTQTCVVDLEPVTRKPGFSVERQSDKLVLRINEGLLMEADLYDALGKRPPGKVRVTGKSAEWLVADWQPGTYYLQATFDSGIVRRKVIIAR